MAMTNAQRSLIEAVARRDIEAARAYAAMAIRGHRQSEWRDRMLEDLGRDGFSGDVPARIRGFVSVESPESFSAARHFAGETERGVVDDVLRMHRVALRLGELGVRVPNSVLLHGEPGTGKTTLAKRIAREIGVPTVVLDAPCAITSAMGGTASNVSDVFRYAATAPCVLVVDEIDCLSSSREAGGGSASREYSSIVTSLINSMDRMSCRQTIVATTNRVDVIDPAILRRFRIRREVRRYRREDRLSMAEVFFRDLGVGVSPERLDRLAAPDRTQSDLYSAMVELLATMVDDGIL